MVSAQICRFLSLTFSKQAPTLLKSRGLRLVPVVPVNIIWSILNGAGPSSPPSARAVLGETLTEGLIVKHNVCLWSLRCQSSILDKHPADSKPSLCVCLMVLCMCESVCARLQCEGTCVTLREKDKCRSVFPSQSSLYQPLMMQSKDRQYFMGLKLSAGRPPRSLMPFMRVWAD